MTSGFQPNEKEHAMGVDLRLLPFDCDRGEFAYSHTILDCERRRSLWTAVEKLPATPVPKGFTSFVGDRPDGESGYGVTAETPYGEPLMATTAGQLLILKDHEGVIDNHKNRAIWAYLAELPPETRVALYWH